MTLHPALPTRTDDFLGPLVCFKCGVTAHQDQTVYQRITITGEKQFPLCSWCAAKLDRATRMSRRGDCEQ